MEAIAGNNSKEGEGDWRNADFLTFEESPDGDDADANNDDADCHVNDEVEEEDESINVHDEKQQGEETVAVDKTSILLPPWMTVAPSPRINPLIRLHNEIVDFCTLMQPKPQELQQREALVARFRTLVHSCFGGSSGDCKVTVFGSQATGLLLPTSDIDIVIDLKEGVVAMETKDDNTQTRGGLAQEQHDMENWNVNDSAMAKSPLQRLAAVIREQWFDELEYLEVIENTRVPLVKLTTTAGLSIDVCFNQENGPKAAQLMKTYLQAMPPLRPLTFVLKYFLASRGLNEPYSGGIGSYLLQLMIVSFLQHRERDSYNNDRPSVYNLGCLLVEFLELYGMDMNYVTTGISVRHDGFYFPKGAMDRKDIYYNPARPFTLAMENPLDPSMDVGKASFRISIIQRAMDVAFKVLLAHVAEPVLQVPSILASILPSSPEMQVRAGKLKTNRKPRIDRDMDNDDDDEMQPPQRKRQRRS
jgi:non-canonical poly(A) RNA polymerase PAPD5/7